MFWNSEKQQKSDEETAQAMANIADELSNPVKAYKIFKLFLAVNILFWLIAFFIPNILVRFFLFLGIGKITFIILGFPLFFGMCFAYTILRIKFSDSEDNSTLDSNFMGSMNYQNSANKRYFIWTASILFGIFNVFMLGAVSFTLDQYDLYLFNY